MEQFKLIQENLIRVLKERDEQIRAGKKNLLSAENLMALILRDHKIYITISRLWKNPQIMTILNRDGISLTISFQDFVKALTEEIQGKLPFITKKGTQKTIKKIIENISEGIKEESKKLL